MRSGFLLLQPFRNIRKYRSELNRYLLLLLLPLILGVALFVSINYVITAQIEARAELVVNNFSEKSDAILREIQIIGNTLIKDRELRRALNTEDLSYEDSDDLCSLISDYANESTHIDGIYVISERTERIYSDKSRYAYESLAYITNKIGLDISAFTGEAAPSGTVWHILNRGGIAPFCVIPIPNANNQAPDLVVITMKMTNYLRIVFTMDVELFCIFSDDFFISSLLRSAPSDLDWRDEQAVSDFLGTPVNCFYKENGSITYLAAISRSSYYTPLAVIIACFSIYFLLVLVLGYLYLYRISRKRYTEIAMLIDVLPQAHPVDTPFNDIISAIHKSLLDFRDKIDDIQELAVSRNLHNILYGYYGTTVSESHLKAAGLSSTCGQYYVVTFFADELLNIAPTSTSKPDVIALIRVMLRSALSNLSCGKLCFSSCTDKSSLTAVFGAKSVEQFWENVLKVSSDTVKIFSDNYGMALQSAVSGPVTDPAKLTDAFEETKKLRAFARSIDSDAPIISQRELFTGSDLLDGDFVRQIQMLTNTLLAEKYDVIPSMVCSILDKHVVPLRKSYALVDRRLAVVSNLLSESVLTINLEGFSPSDAAERLHSASSVSLLNTESTRIFSEIAELLSSGTDNNSIMAQACEYIQSNISDQDLSVAAICNHTQVSAQRLTRMFHARFDMAVAEYMNACRIALAKELLQDKRLTVATVASRVGYNSADTLARNFRKREGLTPTEYRKLRL